MSNAPLPQVLAELFSHNPGMAARMLKLHVDDGTGLCAECTGHTRHRWPCVLAGVTAAANEVERRRDQLLRRST